MARPKDETYVIDLCDAVLNAKAYRGHRFNFLLGDPGKNGRRAKLPVDAYYPDHQLVIEYHERQHTEAVDHFDKRRTISGVSRREQRKKYDERRKLVLPEKGIRLIILEYCEFDCNGAKKLRRVDRDREVVEQKLSAYRREAWQSI